MAGKEKKGTDSTGTARATHELSEYEMLEYDYDEDVALSVTTRAFQRHDTSITREDVRSTVKVVRAARTGIVDVAAERERMESKAEAAVTEILNNIGNMEEEAK
ncbi:hypothetical protein QVN42_16960 [Yersinia nurmii]|uniref:Transcription factor CBF/NF-Y/archaeal histone domain-containing protein n=1 Tax=Yersinia nurmii TaxID=685706 RepID=A0AAW7K2M7_9GAMM|nr:hypothetical protein [Yersinia nurmii]MDN0089044.1 hypothetical protein [Yersinia nurmii]